MSGGPLPHQFLKEVGLFEFMTDDEVKRLFDLGRPKTFAAGVDIIREGEPGGTVHVLMNGTARVLQAVTGGEPGEKVIADLVPGSAFGEMSLFDGAPYGATVRASEECLVFVVEGPKFLDFLKANPEIGAKVYTTLIRLMANRLRRANLHLTGMGPT